MRVTAINDELFNKKKTDKTFIHRFFIVQLLSIYLIIHINHG